MSASKKNLSYNDNQSREIILRYFYDRNKNATSRMGKKGSFVKISDLRADLKTSHNLQASEVVSNLNYLISQGWVEEKTVSKSFTNPKGLTFPSQTEFYNITASGIDKIDGPSPFTKDRFEGIRIEATGQNIITVGDGNQINIKYKETAEALIELRNAITKSQDLDEEVKLEVVSDIDSIQGQLAKPNPNKTVISSLWNGIHKAASVATLADVITKVSPFIIPLFS